MYVCMYVWTLLRPKFVIINNTESQYKYKLLFSTHFNAYKLLWKTAVPILQHQFCTKCNIWTSPNQTVFSFGVSTSWLHCVDCVLTFNASLIYSIWLFHVRGKTSVNTWWFTQRRPRINNYKSRNDLPIKTDQEPVCLIRGISFSLRDSMCCAARCCVCWAVCLSIRVYWVTVLFKQCQAAFISRFSHWIITIIIIIERYPDYGPKTGDWKNPTDAARKRSGCSER
jgi:hypothetical protein